MTATTPCRGGADKPRAQLAANRVDSMAWDPATVVRFDAQPRPADTVTLRYEYAPALRALGLLPPPWDRDRLRERERGDGFARPPAW